MHVKVVVYMNVTNVSYTARMQALCNLYNLSVHALNTVSHIHNTYV
jgi:hypothetical protein